MTAYQFILRNEKARLYDRFAILLLVLSVAAVFFNKWFAISMLILFIFYFVSKKKLKVIISSTGISYPSFPPKRINWNQLSNIILKDGLLTIDMKNNHIIQQEVEEKQSPADEKQFNEFCMKQMERETACGKRE